MFLSSTQFYVNSLEIKYILVEALQINSVTRIIAINV